MRTWWVILTCLGCGWAGCAAPAGPEGPTAAGLWLRDAQAFDRQWDTALSVLRKHGFVPDRQDTRAGVITTLPLTSRQSWEFWRGDCCDRYYQAECDLHTVRRLARVEFERRSDLGEYQLGVLVDVERLSRPERAVMLASGAMNLYGTAMPTTAGRQPGLTSDIHWVSLGRDEVLERRLLTEMTRGLREVATGLQPPPPAPPLPAPEGAQQQEESEADQFAPESNLRSQPPLEAQPG